MADNNRQPDLKEILARLGDLEVELAAAREETAALKEELARKDQIIAGLQQRLFGKSSERIDPNQLDLDFDEALLGKPEPLPETGDTGDAPEEAGGKRKRRRRKKAELYPENLRIVIDGIIIPAEVEADPAAWKEIDGEHHDELDVTPASMFWRRTTCKKFVRRDGGGAPIMAPMPEPSLPGTLCAPGLAAQIIVDKHCDHLPHFRQSKRFKRRHKIELRSSTINAWSCAAAKHLAPIGLAIRDELLGASYLQGDETPIDYLSPGHGKTKQGYLWVYHAPELKLTYYNWQLGRSHQALVEVLGDGSPGSYIGALDCDGFGAYETYLRLRGKGISLGACLAHIRRKFYEARGQDPPAARLILTEIQRLYRIETEMHEGRTATTSCRFLIRQTRSKPICEKLKKHIIAEKNRHLPKSKFGEAVRYALGQWSKFESYLSEGEMEIDNNLVENAIRPTKLGAKNYMFFGSAEAGELNALLYTLIETSKHNDLDPEEYLAEVIRRLPANATAEQAAELTPAKIAETRRLAEDAA
jgi:transposase